MIVRTTWSRLPEYHYDYLISAIFSEFVSNTELDGILYPGVRVDGKGFNIAIKPSAVDKLSLRVAGECSIYKLKYHTVVGNDAKRNTLNK